MRSAILDGQARSEKPTAEQTALQQKVDALVEFVHRGGSPLLDVFEVLEAISPAMHPNGSTNYEYRFAWNDDCNPETLEIDWNRPRKRILRRTIKSKDRLKRSKRGPS